MYKYSTFPRKKQANNKYFYKKMNTRIPGKISALRGQAGKLEPSGQRIFRGKALILTYLSHVILIQEVRIKRGGP
jgi:hypothetical protein